MEKRMKLIPRCSELLERRYLGKKAGVVATAAGSVLNVILLLPIFGWVQVVNIPALFAKLGITRDMAQNLYTSYSIFNLLSFVQEAGQGRLGLYAMILLVIMVASLYFNVAYVVQAAFLRKKNKGDLGLFATGRTAMLFQMILSIAAFGYVLFANSRFEMRGFRAAFPVYIALAISLLSYLAIKIMEAKERERYHEHGLLKELRKNWVLFLMLVPTFVYFMINNYLPMIGVYYAFTSL